MSLHLRALLRAAIRIEKKLDELLKLTLPIAQKQTGSPVPPMPQPLNIASQGACPVCQQPVTYQGLVDPETGEQVPVRMCGCEPVVIQLNQGDQP